MDAEIPRYLLRSLVYGGAALAATAAGPAGAVADSGPLIQSQNRAARSVQLPAPPRDPPAWALRATNALTVEQRVGQVLVAGFDGQRAPAFVRSALRADRLSGVILFGPNVTSRGQLQSLTASLRSVSRGGALVSVDQEGGQVRRIPFARPRDGQPRHGSVAGVERVARAGGRDLQRLGLNVNFAPVADVPADSGADIFQRAFRGSPATIGRKVAAAVRGYRQHRVAATVKHFPGLGGAPRNTDDAAVRIPRSRSVLERIDLAPFRAAITADAALIMASHAIYPALDRTRLASQSPAVLGGLLRRRLGYRGAVVTDALEARAVLQRMSVARAAERSLQAGCDLLLVTRPAGYGPAFRRLLLRARDSAAVRRRLEESVARVLVLKRSLGLRVPG